MAATLDRPNPTPESIRADRAREIAQARLNWQTTPRDLLTIRARSERLYARSSWTWCALKATKKEIEERMISLLDVVQHPSDLTTGATWTLASLRVEEARAELEAIKGAFRRLAVTIKEATDRYEKMGDWLSAHPDCEDYERREKVLLAQYDLILKLMGWPSESMEHRVQLFKLASLNQFPAVPALRIRPTQASWQMFLLSQETTEAMLAEASKSWRL